MSKSKCNHSWDYDLTVRSCALCGKEQRTSPRGRDNRIDASPAHPHPVAKIRTGINGDFHNIIRRIVKAFPDIDPPKGKDLIDVLIEMAKP